MGCEGSLLKPVADGGYSSRRACSNDATALVAYQAALGAAATAFFSVTETGAHILVVGFGGILVGLAVGRATVWLRRRLNDAPVEVTISSLTPFAAYLPAERLGLSGVLAPVTAGVFVGWFAPWIMESETRVRGRAIWQFLVRHAGEPFEDVVNHSIMQTLTRSRNTTLTVVLTLLVLILFGGTSIRPFCPGVSRRNHRGRLLGSVFLEHAPGQLACG